MAQNVETVGALDLDRFHDVVGRQRQVEVTQFAVDPYRHDAAVVTEQVEPGRGRVRHALLPGVVRGDGDRHAGHVRFLPERGAAPPRAPRVRVNVTAPSLDRLSAADEMVKSGNAAVAAQRGHAVEVTPVTERWLDSQARGPASMG